MTLEIQFLTGSRAGTSLRFSAGAVTVGRHPNAALRFGAQDERVSARHAVLMWDGERWLVRDVGSTNGTFLNGIRLTGESYLRDGDRLEFGSGEAAVQLRVAGNTPVPPPGTASAPRTVTGPAVRDSSSPSSSTTNRMRSLARRRHRWLAMLAAGLSVGLAATVVVFVRMGRHQELQWEQQRTELQARLDSVLAAGERAVLALEDQLEELTTALLQTQQQVRQVRSELARAEADGNADQITALRRELQTATAALERQQAAATVDFAEIRRTNGPAVARVWVEYEDGEVTTGTAFAIRPDALLLTVRHAVAGADGTRRASRIGVQFSGSTQVWPARLVARSEVADLALLKIDNILGAVPVVRGLNPRTDTIQPGAAVAVIGFPYGGENGGALTTEAARPVVSAGVVSAVATAQLEMQGYGAAGSSGSPIFDTQGQVAGILFAGRHDPSGHTVFAVPAALALSLLDAASVESALR